MLKLKLLMTEILRQASLMDQVRSGYICPENYKPVDFNNPKTPSSSFFKLSSDDMLKELISMYDNYESACSYVDFYVNRSVEYMADEDFLKFIKLKEKLKAHYSEDFGS